MDLKIKDQINKLNVEKYRQYGYHTTGETKVASDMFDDLLASLQKINTDLTSLSLSVERVKSGNANPLSLSDLRELLNHVIDAKKKIKQSTFKSFLPSELDDIKKIYGTIQQFLESIEEFQAFNLENEKLLKEQLIEEYEDAQLEYAQDPTEENRVEMLELEDAIQEVSAGINEDEKLSRSKSFKLYFNTIIEIQKLIENKLLRNEGNVTAYAKQIGGSSTYYNWIHSHQGSDFI
jgi:hypothetical protein